MSNAEEERAGGSRACGRQRRPAHHIVQLDAILEAELLELLLSCTERGNVSEASSGPSG